jgi:hypothetical protein
VSKQQALFPNYNAMMLRGGEVDGGGRGLVNPGVDSLWGWLLAGKWIKKGYYL